MTEVRKDTTAEQRVSVSGLQDLFHSPRLSKPEMHLLLKPFFVLDKHTDRLRPIDYITTAMVDGKAVTRRWFVQPHALYGLPGAFDRDVTIALYEMVNELYFARNLPVPKIMPIGSIRNYVSRMGLAVSGKNVKAVKESLRRLHSTLCTAEQTFFNNKRKRYTSQSFRLLRGVGFSGDEDGNGGQHEENFIIFDESILENLNSGYVMVIDVDSFRGLKKDIAKQLYSHLSYRFYIATEEGLDHWVADYQWLALHLGVKVWNELRRAKAQLKKSHELLKEEGYIKDYRWDGWRIIYRPGHVWTGEQLRRRRGKIKKRPDIAKLTSIESNEEVCEDPLVPVLAAFANGLAVGEKRIKELGLTVDEAKVLCNEKNIPLSN